MTRAICMYRGIPDRSSSSLVTRVNLAHQVNHETAWRAPGGLGGLYSCGPGLRGWADPSRAALAQWWGWVRRTGWVRPCTQPRYVTLPAACARTAAAHHSSTLGRLTAGSCCVSHGRALIGGWFQQSSALFFQSSVFISGHLRLPLTLPALRGLLTA